MKTSTVQLYSLFMGNYRNKRHSRNGHRHVFRKRKAPKVKRRQQEQTIQTNKDSDNTQLVREREQMQVMV